MSRATLDASLIARAAEWRLLSLLLERPRPGWHDEVAALDGEVRNRSLRAAATAARAATEGEYLRFIGPGGLVSPREVSYQPFQDPGHLLAQLATVYAAFAFHPHVEDPIDHLAVEVQFVGYLLLKEAFATARGDAAAAATTAAARHAFIDAHLVAVAAPFATRLQAAGATLYLVQAARLLAKRVPRPPRSVVHPPADAPTGLADSCDACVAGFGQQKL